MGNFWKNLGKAFTGNLGSIITSAIGGIVGAVGTHDTNSANRDIAKQTNEANQKIAEQNIQMQKETNAQNVQMVRETNAQNYKMAQEQNQWNLEQWNRENEYNSPLNQRQRLVDAGINPLFADYANQGSTGLTAVGSTAEAPQNIAPQNTAQVEGYGYTSPLGQLKDTLKDALSIRKLETEIKKQENENDLFSLEHGWKDKLKFQVREEKDENGEKDADGNPIVRQVAEWVHLDGTPLSPYEKSQWDSIYYSGLNSRALARINQLNESEKEQLFGTAILMGQEKLNELQAVVRKLDDQHKLDELKLATEEERKKVLLEYGLDLDSDYVNNIIRIGLTKPEKFAEIIDKLAIALGNGVGSILSAPFRYQGAVNHTMRNYHSSTPNRQY